jgi:hypothetical protein
MEGNEYTYYPAWCTKNKWPGYLMKEVIGSDYVNENKTATYEKSE